MIKLLCTALSIGVTLSTWLDERCYRFLINKRSLSRLPSGQGKKGNPFILYLFFGCSPSASPHTKWPFWGSSVEYLKKLKKDKSVPLGSLACVWGCVRQRRWSANVAYYDNIATAPLAPLSLPSDPTTRWNKKYNCYGLS